MSAVEKILLALLLRVSRIEPAPDTTRHRFICDFATPYMLYNFHFRISWIAWIAAGASGVRFSSCVGFDNEFWTAVR